MTLPIFSLRTLLFRLHWALGLTAGLVLALMGLTGALMSYEEAVTAFANRDRLEVAPGGRTALSPATLAARIDAQAGGRVADALTLSDDPRASVHVRFARDPGTRARPPSEYADPYDGALLGPVRGEPSVDRAALAGILLGLAAVGDGDERIRSIDLNPVFAMPDGEGAYAADAVIELGDVA